MAYYKIVVMGKPKVGKTALIEQYVYGRFLSEYNPTIEDVYEKNTQGAVNKNGKQSVHLHFWDTSGETCEDDIDMNKSRERARYYEFADAVILVYDAENKDNTFTAVKIMRNEIEKTRCKHVIVLCNKLDLADQPGHSAWAANHKLDYFVVSAKQGHTLEEPMLKLVSMLTGSSSHQSTIKRVASRTSVNLTFPSKFPQ